jgi:hypothetical protein
VAADQSVHYAWVATRGGAPYASHAGIDAAGGAFAFTPDDDGVYEVTLTVTDDDGGQSVAPRTVVAANVAPIPDVEGDALGVRGQQRSLTLGAADPSPVDQAFGFTYTVDWGDGSPVQSYGLGTTAVNHTYAAASETPYSVRVTATDRNGAAGGPIVVSILVQSANVQGGVLAVSGGVGNDPIRVFGSPGAISVGISDVDGRGFEFVETYADPITRVVVFGQAGDDHVTAAALTVPVEIFGGAGADRLIGDADDDILIGGYTAHDGDLLALRLIAAEWNSTRSYPGRIDNLRGTTPGGLNGPALLRADVTTWDDRAVDLLAGEAGRDWFLFNADRDGVVAPASSELLDDVDGE